MKASQSKVEITRLVSLGQTLVYALDWRALAAFSLPFTVYLLTLAPTVYNLDSAELTTAAAKGGLMRATGYPLYLTLGHLWSKIPLGDVGYRMNLFSAFNGALTIFFADRILHRWRVSAWATFGALGLLATGTYFWGMSLIAEVYTLHTALMAGLIWALLRWRDHPSALRLALFAGLTGMSLAHHAASALLLPGTLFYLFANGPRRVLTLRSLTALAVGGMLGLSFYLYLPVRYAAQPAFNYAGQYDASLSFSPVNLQSLDGMLWLVTGRAFMGKMLAYRGPELWREIWRFGQQLAQAFFIVGIGPGILGLILLFKRSWREAGLLALMFAISAGFYIDYQVIDKNTMFLPAYLVWALWVGAGFHTILAWVKKSTSTGHRFHMRNLLHGAILATVSVSLVWNWRLVDLSSDWSARERGEAILQRVQPGALVIGWWDTIPVIQYLQLVEGQRTDVQALNRFLIAHEDLRNLIRQEVNYRPIYIDSPSNDLTHGLEAHSIGPIYQIQSPR